MAETRMPGKDVMARKRLDHWRAVIERDKSAWAAERDKMGWREELFDGTKRFKPVVAAEIQKKDTLVCFHVRNVIAENIESMVDSRVPRPKVIALDKNDEGLARELEELLRFTSDRLHLRAKNDVAERMGPIQGGVFWFLEWDDSIRTPDGQGDVKITILHPKQIVPQAGIYTDVEDMDHITAMIPMTAMQVWQRYGVDVFDLAEEEPGSKAREEQSGAEAEIVTVYQLYYKNGRGGIGNLAWTGDRILSNREDYQARRVLRCKRCGAVASYAQAADPERREELEISGQYDDSVRRCSRCEGTEFEETEVREQAVMPGDKTELMLSDGEEIHLEPAASWLDEKGRLHIKEKDTLPYYTPDLLPIILQKNISLFGRLLGQSDVDKMEDAQNLIKRMDKKIIDRSVKAGTIVTMPTDVMVEPSTEDAQLYRIDDPAKVSMFNTYEFSGDVSGEISIGARAYEEARQASGVTDSMQGRRDPTATSAKAKEYSASKAEGRMESRRVMKQVAWSKIYELIAKLYLAYADEERRIRVELPTGGVEYHAFRRGDFLKKDRDGSYYYEDGFIFTVDDATSIGESREAMWKEINAAFTAGTLGNPQKIETLILYWGLMEEQSYPGAGAIKKKLEEQLEQLTAQQNAAPQVPPTGQVPGMAPQG